MSILNLFVEPDGESVEIWTDTAAAGATLSKCLAVPHLGAAVAWRGHFGIGFGAFCALATMQDFDAALKSFAADGMAWVAEQARRHGQGIEGPQDVVIAGWSPARARYRVTYFHSEDARTFNARHDAGSTIAPWPDSLWDPPAPRSTGEMIALAERQLAFLRASGAAGGGQLIRTALEPGGKAITIDTLHEFKG